MKIIYQPAPQGRNQIKVMPQSLVKNYLHIVFSTKNRYPFIKKPVQEELFSYLGGVCRDLGCNPIQVGGFTNHVHILCLLSQKIALMDLLEETKSHSSKCPPDRTGRDKDKRKGFRKLLLAKRLWCFFCKS